MLGAGREVDEGLASFLSGKEDERVSIDAFDDFCTDHEKVFDVAQSGEDASFSSTLQSLGNFDEDLTEFDAVERENRVLDRVLNPVQAAVVDNAGTAWPTPYRAPDFYTNSGVLSSMDLGDVTHRWYRDLAIQRSPYAIAPGGLGEQAPLNASDPKIRGFRAVVASSLEPATGKNRKTSLQLLEQANALAGKTEKRLTIATQAREGFQRALRQTDALDQRAALMARRMLGPDGMPRPGTTEADLDRLEDVRKKAFNFGRRAVRYQKVNALASSLAQNGIAQTDVLQKTAAMVLSGNTGAVAALGEMFNQLGEESEKLRKIRATQVAKWSKNEDLQGLGALDAIGALDTFEATLNGMELSDLEAFGRLRGRLRKKLKKAVKKAAKKVGKRAKKAAKKVGKRAKKVGKKTKKIAKKAGKSVKAVAKDVGKISKSVGKISITPFKATVKGTKRLAKGDVRGAFKAVGKVARSSAKEVGKIGGVLLNRACKIANSKIAQTAIQTAANAVGTIYGGPVGGAAGSVAAKQATSLNSSMCKALDTVGFTKGTYRKGSFKKAAKGFAKDFYRDNLSPKAWKNKALTFATSAATGGAGGGVAPGADLLSKVGSQAVGKLGLQELAQRASKETLQRVAKEQAKKLATKVAKKTARTQALRLSRRTLGTRTTAFLQTAARLRQQGKLEPQTLIAQAQKITDPRARAQLLALAQKEATQRASARVLKSTRLPSKVRRFPVPVTSRGIVPTHDEARVLWLSYTPAQKRAILKATTRV